MKMSEKDDENFREIYDRLRETEAQTREQNTRISSLCDRLENFTEVTDKFFELEDKRHKADDDRFNSLVEHEKRLSDAAEKRYMELIETQKNREEKFWKIITLLIGSVIAIALGPKMFMEIYKTCTGKNSGSVSYFYMNPICPMHEHHNNGIGLRIDAIA